MDLDKLVNLRPRHPHDVLPPNFPLRQWNSRLPEVDRVRIVGSKQELAPAFATYQVQLRDSGVDREIKDKFNLRNSEVRFQEREWIDHDRIKRTAQTRSGALLNLL